MFRSCTNIIKLNRANPGSFPSHVIPIRTYKNIPFKKPSMNELPVPSGSWSANYAKRNKMYNAYLLLGVGVFGATLTYIKKSGMVDLFMGPKIGSIESSVSKDSEEKSSSKTPQVSPTSEEKPSQVSPTSEEKPSVPKSEQGSNEIEVVVVPEVGKEQDEHESSSKLESETLTSSHQSSKDTVIVAESSDLDLSSDNSTSAKISSKLDQ